MKYFESQLRLGTGLVLALYVVQHLVNHSFGIVSIEFAETYRKTVGAMFQNTPAQILLYGSLLFHVAIALRSIYQRSSLRMSLWQTMQLLLGLSILPADFSTYAAFTGRMSRLLSPADGDDDAAAAPPAPA